MCAHARAYVCVCVCVSVCVCVCVCVCVWSKAVKQVEVGWFCVFSVNRTTAVPNSASRVPFGCLQIFAERYFQIAMLAGRRRTA